MPAHSGSLLHPAGKPSLGVLGHAAARRAGMYAGDAEARYASPCQAAMRPAGCSYHRPGRADVPAPSLKNDMPAIKAQGHTRHPVVAAVTFRTVFSCPGRLIAGT